MSNDHVSRLQRLAILKILIRSRVVPAIISVIALLALAGCVSTAQNSGSFPLATGSNWQLVPPEFDLTNKTIVVLPFRGDANFSSFVEYLLSHGTLYAEVKFDTGVFPCRITSEQTAALLPKVKAGLPYMYTSSMLDKLLQAKHLKLVDLMNWDTALAISRLVGIQYILTGEIQRKQTSANVEFKVLCSQLIDVQTGQKVWSYAQSATQADAITNEMLARQISAQCFVGSSFFWHVRGGSPAPA